MGGYGPRKVLCPGMRPNYLVLGLGHQTKTYPSRPKAQFMHQFVKYGRRLHKGFLGGI
jgi:hypothetical protein